VVIDAASIDSGVDEFDDHLKSADFFGVANNPQITFKSTAVSLAGGARGTVTGDLTIKGVTKPVTFDITINRAANDDFAQAYKLGFSAAGVVKRSDFGVDKYVPFVGDDVSIVIESEFLLPRETAPAQ
jgi:polyisoprenoid-binding protein YceI